MIKGLVVLGRWAILAVVVGSVVLLTGCGKPCDSWLSDTKGGKRYCSGERFGETVPKGVNAHWTPPVMEPTQEDQGCKVKKEWCA